MKKKSGPTISTDKRIWSVNTIKEIWTKIPEEIKYILFLFFSTRLALTIIGVISNTILQQVFKRPAPWNVSKHLWLNLWCVHDASWYTGIATNWYAVNHNFDPSQQSFYAFFPLFPGLMRLLGFVLQDYYISGMILASTMFILAAIYLFKLIQLEFDAKIATRAVTYLFVFPTAFIFSGAFTESLFLFLVLICFYYARKEKWLVVGIASFFLALTRALGFLVIFPLLYAYFRERDRKSKLKKLHLLYILLPVLAMILFLLYNYYLTRDYLAFLHIRKSWGTKGETFNPFTSFWMGLVDSKISIFDRFNAYFIIIMATIYIAFIKKIRFSYWLYGCILIFIPMLMTRMPTPLGMASLSRYILPAFPIYLMFALWGEKSKTMDQINIIVFTLFQGFLMAFWSNGIPLLM